MKKWLRRWGRGEGIRWDVNVENIFQNPEDGG